MVQPDHARSRGRAACPPELLLTHGGSGHQVRCVLDAPVAATAQRDICPTPSDSPMTPCSTQSRSTRPTKRPRESKMFDLWHRRPVGRSDSGSPQTGTPASSRGDRRPVQSSAAALAAYGQGPASAGCGPPRSRLTPARTPASAIGRLISAGRWRRQSATVRAGEAMVSAPTWSFEFIGQRSTDGSAPLRRRVDTRCSGSMVNQGSPGLDGPPASHRREQP